MSAETLREAATKMHALAHLATPGPWRVGAEGSEGSRVNPDTGDKREDSRYIASVNGRSQPEDGANAALIAAMGPTFAREVATWLEHYAAVMGAGHPIPFDFDALAVARAFLGRDS